MSSLITIAHNAMHPFVKILYFVLILILMSFLSNQLLSLLLILICTLAASLQLHSFLRVIIRMRWLFLSIVIIYAFGTPGELVPYLAIDWAPTFEGLESGMLQIAKLLIALAALNILFVTSTRQQLIVGLYMALSPFRYLGLDIKKFAVRLFLTLEYVEVFSAQKGQEFSFKHFDDIYLTMADEPIEKVVVFEELFFDGNDKLMMGIFVVCVIGLPVLRWWL